MKKSIFRPLLLLLFVIGLVLPSFAENGQPESKKEFVQTIERNFKISADGKVNLSNRHGKVDIKTWDKNEVDIKVTITVNARSESAAQEAFDRISVDFSNGNDYVKAETSIASQNKSWWGSATSSSKVDFKIDYLVQMPKSNNLKLANKYGASFVENIDGNTEADIKYGDLNMAKVGGTFNLVLGYGNGTVDQTDDATIDIKYGKIRLQRAKDINIESKYSKIYFEEVGDIRSTSKYDNFDLGHIGKLRNDGKYDHFEIQSANEVDISSRYTDIRIDQLKEAAVIDLSYGGVRIKDLDRGFSEIDIKGDYADCKIGVQSGASYQLIVSTRYGNISHPDDMEVTHEKRQSHSHEIKGYVGSEKSNSIIKASASYANVKIY